ncbi:hypothetical protein WJX72_009850 [[Myrmecia] bisecta]|uniref:Uncharacterized protein n=1 Tax=[Myrmecia] bisecta TaxID=41462 RepID=A0AAW1PB00_9CHLO
MDGVPTATVGWFEGWSGLEVIGCVVSVVWRCALSPCWELIEAQASDECSHVSIGRRPVDLQLCAPIALLVAILVSARQLGNFFLKGVFPVYVVAHDDVATLPT